MSSSIGTRDASPRHCVSDTVFAESQRRLFVKAVDARLCSLERYLKRCRRYRQTSGDQILAS